MRFVFILKYRQATICLVYQKMLKLVSDSRRSTTSGQMTNLISVDSLRIMDFIWLPHDWWASIVVIFANLGVLYWLVGYPALVGGVLLLLLGICQQLQKH